MPFLLRGKIINILHNIKLTFPIFIPRDPIRFQLFPLEVKAEQIGPALVHLHFHSSIGTVGLY
jgi:hypothetical protein